MDTRDGEPVLHLCCMTWTVRCGHQGLDSTLKKWAVLDCSKAKFQQYACEAPVIKYLQQH